jgi:hypothetical protein
MDEAVEQLARRMLIQQAIALIEQVVTRLGPFPSTEDLAMLAVVSNVAHLLSLNEVLKDARNLGYEFYPDQLSIIMRRIPVEDMLTEFVGGSQSSHLVLDYVRRAFTPPETGEIT